MSGGGGGLSPGLFPSRMPLGLESRPFYTELGQAQSEDYGGYKGSTQWAVSLFIIDGIQMRGEIWCMASLGVGRLQPSHLSDNLQR